MFKVLPSSKREFRRQVLAECVGAIRYNHFEDNFDHQRYSSDGVDRSEIYKTDSRAFWIEYFNDHLDQLWAVFELLEDQFSKRMLCSLLAYKISGWQSVKLPIRYDYQDGLKSVRSMRRPVSSEVDVAGKYGSLNNFEIEWLGTRVHVVALVPPSCVTRNSYFPPSEASITAPAPGDFVVDGGACFGDTAIMLAVAVGETGRVFSFEPVECHLQVAQLNCRMNPRLQIRLFKAGLGSTSRQADPVQSRFYDPGFRINDQTPLCRLDDMIENGEIEKVNYIKLDIEGYEMAALKGACGSIAKFKPKLAICLYHKPEDLFTIPLWIKENFPHIDYKFFLDHHSIHSEETVLYAAV